MDLESLVLERIRPKPDEVASIVDKAERLRAIVQAYLKDNGFDVKVRFVGSYAKGTFLSNTDLDLFLLFPESVPRAELESTGLKIGDDILHGVRMYSEHPYVRGSFEGIDVDMVPSYELQCLDRLRTAVDRTPFHTDYIISRMSEDQKDQVRLLKAFMKGIGAYGAEPNTRGFSGYLCELLVLHYGSFIEVLKATEGWKDGTTIIVEGKRGPPMVSSLILYDPVDSKRNVSSSVHLDTMSLLIVAAKAYLARPSDRFFFPNDQVPMTKEELESEASTDGARILTVVFKRPNTIEENLYSQIWKTQYALARKLNDFDYNVLRAVHEIYDRTMEIAFELERDVLSKTHKHVGPPVWVKNSEVFLRKWKDNPYGMPFIEDGCWNVIAERMYFTAKEMLIDEVAIAGIGRELDPNTATIRDHESSLRETDPLLLTRLMHPMHPWEI